MCLDFLFCNFVSINYLCLFEIEYLLSMANSGNTDDETLHSAAFILIYTVEKVWC